MCIFHDSVVGKKEHLITINRDLRGVHEGPRKAIFGSNHEGSVKSSPTVKHQQEAFGLKARDEGNWREIAKVRKATEVPPPEISGGPLGAI